MVALGMIPARMAMAVMIRNIPRGEQKMRWRRAGMDCRRGRSLRRAWKPFTMRCARAAAVRINGAKINNLDMTPRALVRRGE
jgi:hypothetical protein